VLQKGKRKRFGYLSFGIYESDLPAFRNRLEQLNVPTIPPPRGFESNEIWFRDEEGKVEVAVKAKSSPMEKSIFREVFSSAGVPGDTLRSRAQITRPRRLSHIALYTTDVSRKLKFYSGVLGLRLSDRVGRMRG
jgi:catechol-2,3-dioxygenase